MSQTYIIGDIHGQLLKLITLLQKAKLVSDVPETAWIGGKATVWFVGDYIDHGLGGPQVLKFITQLQRQATAAGGSVGALLGNHEALALSALQFGETSVPPIPPVDCSATVDANAPQTSRANTFIGLWESHGGFAEELTQFAPYTKWLQKLPAMIAVGPYLLLHADVLMYGQYGTTVDAVNSAVTTLLANNDMQARATFLTAFECHHAFDAGAQGITNAQQLLRSFGASHLIHGHTPVSAMTDQHPSEVTQPYVYAGNLCTNVDGGMYKGGSGFIYTLPDLT